MMRKPLTVATVALATVLTMAASAFADCRAKISLAGTAVATATDASGTAEARAQDAQQRFKVSIDARVADGTTYLVYANGQPAGTITIALGAGELDLNNNNGKTLPAGVDPVCSIGTVEVFDGVGALVLQGSF